ncbi:NAD(P)-dependent oxidoreductase [Kribbella turkmenica]|uniref:NAD(P)-dependent oxidoreductase n=1 Tax=Kribbella turkmenica TaxID=2530375 RepID=A0A4V6PDA4_9ACTN|nr:NAD(P)-binding domain-containing protein [Kribbella turkmenica]TDD27407.1 NAD(P)-dependent oxidoreductase [Kribbella turkmenica]
MRTPVTVLGLGAMGTALARAFLAAGHPTTVWNRTPGRSPELDALGATRAATAAEAVAAGRLVVVCLLDDTTVRATLEPLAAELTGRTLANLTSSLPSRARALADWAAGHGIEFLDGGIMAVPVMIGGPEAFILYSGSTVAFEQYEHDLAAAARPAYVGKDPGLASLHDFTLLSAMYPMLGGAAHALALISREDISPTTFTDSYLVPWLSAMLGQLPAMAKDLEHGPDGPAGSNLAMQANGFHELVDLAVEQGVDPRMLAPMEQLLRRAVDAGHGDEDLAALVPLLRAGA